VKTSEQQAIALVTDDLAPALIDPQKTSFQIAVGDPHRRILEGAAKTRFT
jgi:hypothetical protein